MGITAEQLVREYHSRLHGYVRLRVPAQDCEDLVGDIFLRAMERQDQLRGDPGAWLFAIACNRVAQYHRDNKGAAMRTVVTDADPARQAAPASSTAPLERLEHDEFRDRLRTHMRGLSELERNVIALKFTDGLANTQIAEVLGVTPNHLGVVLHRALQRLRDAMIEEVR